MDILINSEADPSGLGFDWAMLNGDLAIDQTLKTNVILSLFSDRLAASDDVLPDNSANRRGWWGDLPLDGGAPDLIGSRLWLLSRDKATAKTATRAQRFALEALQWLLDDGIAKGLNVSTEWASREQLRIIIKISRDGPNGATIDHRYDVLWRFLPSGAISLPVDDGRVLADEHADILSTAGGQFIGI